MSVIGIEGCWKLFVECGNLDSVYQMQIERPKVFTPTNCLKLVRKYEELDHVGPALETLRRRISPTTDK